MSFVRRALVYAQVSDDNTIQCFLLGEAVLDGATASKLSAQLKAGKAAYFKALAAGNAAKEATALCCLERYACAPPPPTPLFPRRRLGFSVSFERAPSASHMRYNLGGWLCATTWLTCTPPSTRSTPPKSSR
jgi:hypothetical protein